VDNNNKQSMHQVIAGLKKLKDRLGRTPKRADLKHNPEVSFHWVERYFGTFSDAIKAAGLAPTSPSKEVIKNVLAKDVCEHLGNYEYKSLKLNDRKRVVIIGDCHFPFVNPDSLSLVYSIIEHVQPQVIFQIGDLYDMYAHSRFPRSTNNYNAYEEITLARTMAEDMWAKVNALIKNVECHQILGNHDVRPYKKVLANYPEGEVFFSYKKYFEFPNVITHMDTREPIRIDDVLYEHGYRSKIGDHMTHSFENTVVGHSHKGGVVYKSINGQIKFELNAGFIGDAESKALSYTANKITHWTQGVAVIDEMGPRFVSFS